MKSRTRISSDIGIDDGCVTEFARSCIAASRTPYASALTTGELEDRIGSNVDRQLYLRIDTGHAVRGRKQMAMTIDIVAVDGKEMYSV